MKEKVKILVSCALIVICLPYLITYFFQKEQTSTVANSEEYSKIAGILASQVPVTVEEEALKAQAVIVSTQLSWCKENKQEEPQALSKEEMEQLWGQEKYYEFYERMLKAVQDTDGQVITFDGKVINPSFHKVSAGMTRDGSQIYKNTPYLLSVNSKNDVLSDDYLKVQFFTQKEFEERIRTLIKKQNTEEKQEKNLQEYLDMIVLETDGAGYVTKMQVEESQVDIDMFMEAFELPSSCFTIKEMDDHIRIVAKGCGHGFGLSQYGANEMAKDKKKYDEILKYYFSGVKIEKTGKH